MVAIWQKFSRQSDSETVMKVGRKLAISTVLLLFMSNSLNSTLLHISYDHFLKYEMDFEYIGA
jgi:hypothetical protein